MTKEEAIEIFMKKHSGRKVNRVGDEGKHYIIDATDPSKEDEVDPFFAVDKKTGEITNYFPEDLIKFGQMMGYGDEEDDDEDIRHSFSASAWKWRN